MSGMIIEEPADALQVPLVVVGYNAQPVQCGAGWHPLKGPWRPRCRKSDLCSAPQLRDVLVAGAQAEPAECDGTSNALRQGLVSAPKLSTIRRPRSNTRSWAPWKVDGTICLNEDSNGSHSQCMPDEDCAS